MRNLTIHVLLDILLLVSGHFLLEGRETYLHGPINRLLAPLPSFQQDSFNGREWWGRQRGQEVEFGSLLQVG